VKLLRKEELWTAQDLFLLANVWAFSPVWKKPYALYQTNWTIWAIGKCL